MRDITITIVNYKMKEDIEKCLSSLLKDYSSSGLNVQITVVDNASGDDIEKFIAEKFPNVKCVMNEENHGFGRAHNIGIKAFPAKYHFILNPDTYFPTGQNAVRRLYDYMEQNPRVGLVAPKLVYPDESLQYSCYRFPGFWHPFFRRTKYGESRSGRRRNSHLLMHDFSHNETIPVDWVMGSAMFARGNMIAEVGYFDENFWMYYEDSDLCRRLWEKGYPVYYLHDVILHHTLTRGSASTPGIIRAIIKNPLVRSHIRSWLRYMWKWRGNSKYYGTTA